MRKGKSKKTKKNSCLNLIKIIFKSFCYALLVLFIIVISFIYFRRFVSKDSDIFKYRAYVIVSESMVPTINVNDGVIVKSINDPNSLEVGDIITFSSRDYRHSGIIITHRIVGKQKITSGEYVYRTKGDNNNTYDSMLVRDEDIYGKVVFKIPFIGYLNNLVRNPVFIIILCILPLLILIYIDIMNMYKYYNLKKKR